MEKIFICGFIALSVLTVGSQAIAETIPKACLSKGGWTPQMSPTSITCPTTNNQLFCYPSGTTLFIKLNNAQGELLYQDTDFTKLPHVYAGLCAYEIGQYVKTNPNYCGSTPAAWTLGYYTYSCNASGTNYLCGSGGAGSAITVGPSNSQSGQKTCNGVLQYNNGVADKQLCQRCYNS